MNTPRKLGRYEILETLGQGMQSRVYRARDSIFGEVALKAPAVSPDTTPAEIDALRERLAEEARRQRDLAGRCTSILPAHDVVVGEDGVVYVVQAYAPGGSLRDVPRPVRDEVRLLDWGRQLCDALQTAHDASIFHRDVKPENVLRDRDGRLKLTDFGIAVETSRRGGDGRLVGTPPYMAPEIWEANRASAATDVFSLGVLLYELAVDRHPYDLATGDPEQVRRRICDAPDLPVPARKACPALSRDLAEILDKAVARDPADRYASCNAFRRDLDDYLAHIENRETQIVRDGPVAVPLPVRVRRVWRRVRRRAPIPLAVAAVLGLGVAFWQFFPRTLLPEAWIDEKIADFQLSIAETDVDGFLRNVWRNAPGDPDDDARADAAQMFTELAYYDTDTVLLRKVPGGFNDLTQSVSVELVARGRGLPDAERVLATRLIHFDQTERGQLRWRKPTDWIFTADDLSDHPQAVREMFVFQFWRPLRQAIATADAAALAGLYATPPAPGAMLGWLEWLGAYSRPLVLPAWPPDRDPRDGTPFDWVVRFDPASRAPAHQARIAWTMAYDGPAWRLTGPTETEEPSAHVRWAVERLLAQFDPHLKSGTATPLANALADAGSRSFPDDARDDLGACFAWLAKTHREDLHLSVTSLGSDWEPGATTATVSVTLTYRPRAEALATGGAAPTTRNSRTDLASLPVTLTFERTREGRWIPAELAQFAFPEPLALGAARLLAADGDLLLHATKINADAWPARVTFRKAVGALRSAEPASDDPHAAVAIIALRGTYHFVDADDDDNLLFTPAHDVDIALQRTGVRWHLEHLPPDDELAFDIPSEDLGRVSQRFTAAVLSQLRAAFTGPQASLDATAVASLLPPTATDDDRHAIAAMFAWLREYRDDVTFTLTNRTVIAAATEHNTASVNLQGVFDRGGAPGDLGYEVWDRELHFVETVVRPGRPGPTTAPDLRWSLQAPPDGSLRDYAWARPRLVRFAPVAAAVEGATWSDVYDRYLPAAAREALGAALQRMRDWAALPQTTVSLAVEGRPRVLPDRAGQARVALPAALVADFGEQQVRRPLELIFSETDRPAGTWQLTTADADAAAFAAHYLWPEPAAHIRWYVNTRLARAAQAYRERDPADYAAALTGRADDADLFVDTLTEFGPDRFRITTAPPVAEPGTSAVTAALTLTPRDGAGLPPRTLRGRFVWKDGDWVAAAPREWLIDTRTAAGVIRMIRVGRWNEARARSATLDSSEQAKAKPVLDMIRFPTAWQANASRQRHARSGMPTSFRDEHGDTFDLIMTRWPDHGSAYALYVQRTEVSTARCDALWPAVAADLAPDGQPAAAGASPPWRGRDADEVRSRLDGAVSFVTWRQAKALATHRFGDRLPLHVACDLPFEREWALAAETLNGTLTRMAGGVWEWCRDAAGPGHVIRGGCWIHDIVDPPPDSARREIHGPEPHDTIGFRTVIRIPADPIIGIND